MDMLGMSELVGTRLHVLTKAGEDLGLGTYLWNDEFLLDSGTKILGTESIWNVVPKSPVPAFEVTLLSEVRVFEGVRLLKKAGFSLEKGTKIRFEGICVRGWNHGSYVAGKFFYQGEWFWLLMSEVALERAKPASIN